MQLEATLTLSALKWALQPQKLALPAEALEKMHALSEAPPKPGRRLKAAAKQYRE